MGFSWPNQRRASSAEDAVRCAGITCSGLAWKGEPWRGRVWHGLQAALSRFDEAVQR